MVLDSENLVLTSFSLVFLLIYLLLTKKGFEYLKDENQDKFCIKLFLAFFILCIINRIASLTIDLIAFESHQLKAAIHHTYAFIFGIFTIIAITALIQFGSNKFKRGNKQAVCVLICSLLLSFLAIFQGREEKHSYSRLQRKIKYDKPIQFSFEDKKYVYYLPKNSGYTTTTEFFEKSFHSDFALRDLNGQFFFTIISEIDESSEFAPLDDYIERVLESMREKVDSVEINHREIFSFLELGAERLVIISNKNNAKFYFDILFLQRKNYYYQLIMYRNWNCDLAKLREKSDYLIKGFSFINE